MAEETRKEAAAAKEDEYDAEFESVEKSSSHRSTPKNGPSTADRKTAETAAQKTVPAGESKPPVGERKSDALANSKTKFAKRHLCNDPVSFDNFNPFKPLKQISSPRSLEICQAYGVDPRALYHKSYEEVKNSVHPLRRNDQEYLRLLYIDTESKRQQLVSQLRKVRRQSIEFGGTTVPNLTEPITRTSKFQVPFRAVTPTRPEHGAKWHGHDTLSGWPPAPELTHDLEPLTVHKECRRATATTAKELKALVEMIKGRLGAKDRGSPRVGHSSCGEERPCNSLCRSREDGSGMVFSYGKYSADQDEALKRHRRVVEKLLTKRAAEISQHISMVDSAVTQRRRERRAATRQRSLVREIENGRTKERREVVERREDYKREKLLEHIKATNGRSVSLQRQREDLRRLRQEMRKNADYRKFQARIELEKIAKKFNTGREVPVKHMFEVAGLGEKWQMANGVVEANGTYANAAGNNGSFAGDPAFSLRYTMYTRAPAVVAGKLRSNPCPD